MYYVPRKMGGQDPESSHSRDKIDQHLSALLTPYENTFNVALVSGWSGDADIEDSRELFYRLILHIRVVSNPRYSRWGLRAVGTAQ